MATTGKPKTTFVVKYGALSEAVAQAALAPVLIAPRYAIIDKTDDCAVLGDYVHPSSNAIKFDEWPGHTDGAIVDVSSGELFVRNAVIQLNDEPITATVSGNKVTLAEADSVKLVEVSGEYVLADALNDVEVQAGDLVSIKDAEGSIHSAEVVDIRAVYTEATATATAAATNASSTGLSIDATKYESDSSLAYLVSFVEDSTAEWATSGISADIVSLSGDSGFKATVKITQSGLTLSSTGVVISLDNAEGVKAGDAFIVKIQPKQVKSYNELYINSSLGDISGAELHFATGRLTAEYTPASTAMWDSDGSAISLANPVQLVVGGASRVLVSGTVCMAYRELLTDGAMQLFSNMTDGVEDIVGKADPRNPMGMMYACASQVDGAFFYMLATSDDTEEAYIDAVNYVGKYEQVYSHITAKQTPAIQNAVKAMINKYSSKDIAKYKRGWFTPVTEKVSVVYGTDSDGSALVGSVVNNTLTIEGSADAVVAGVRAGDKVRIYTGTSSNSTFGYVEYKISAVVDATTLTLVNAKATGISRIEFLRELTSADYAKALANEARAFASHRVLFVASDKLAWGGFEDVDACYLAATLASMRCALPPHAPMNELVIPGFTVRNEYNWTDADYEVMNAGGVWLVYANDANETVTYHQITTISDGTIAEEDSAVSNGDSIVRTLRTAIRPIASGKANVSEAMLQLIDKVLRANIDYIMGIEYPDIYGPQIQDYKITALYIPDGNRKSIRCKTQLQLPLPLQDGEFEFNLI